MNEIEKVIFIKKQAETQINQIINDANNMINKLGYKIDTSITTQYLSVLREKKETKNNFKTTINIKNPFNDLSNKTYQTK